MVFIRATKRSTVKHTSYIQSADAYIIININIIFVDVVVILLWVCILNAFFILSVL